jgi:hypothetical protein
MKQEKHRSVILISKVWFSSNKRFGQKSVTQITANSILLLLGLAV